MQKRVEPFTGNGTRKKYLSSNFHRESLLHVGCIRQLTLGDNYNFWTSGEPLIVLFKLMTDRPVIEQRIA